MSADAGGCNPFAGREAVGSKNGTFDPAGRLLCADAQDMTLEEHSAALLSVQRQLDDLCFTRSRNGGFTPDEAARFRELCEFERWLILADVA